MMIRATRVRRKPYSRGTGTCRSTQLVSGTLNFSGYTIAIAPSECYVTNTSAPLSDRRNRHERHPSLVQGTRADLSYRQVNCTVTVTFNPTLWHLHEHADRYESSARRRLSRHALRSQQLVRLKAVLPKPNVALEHCWTSWHPHSHHHNGME